MKGTGTRSTSKGQPKQGSKCTGGKGKPSPERQSAKK